MAHDSDGEDVEEELTEIDTEEELDEVKINFNIESEEDEEAALTLAGSSLK